MAVRIKFLTAIFLCVTSGLNDGQAMGDNFSQDVGTGKNLVTRHSCGLILRLYKPVYSRKHPGSWPERYVSDDFGSHLSPW